MITGDRAVRRRLHRRHELRRRRRLHRHRPPGAPPLSQPAQPRTTNPSRTDQFGASKSARKSAAQERMTFTDEQQRASRRRRRSRAAGPSAPTSPDGSATRGSRWSPSSTPTRPPWPRPVAKEFGVARVVTDYRELLADDPHRRHRRGHRQRGALPDLRGTRSRPASTCCARSPCTATPGRPSAPAELAARQGPEDQARLHVPLRPGRHVRQGPDRRRASSATRTSSTATSRTASGSTRHTPLRQVEAAEPDGAEIAVSSIEGYGAPIIDIMHWWVGRPLTSVVGTMRNFVPGPDGPRHRQDAADEHRRRRHVDLRVRPPT